MEKPFDYPSLKAFLEKLNQKKEKETYALRMEIVRCKQEETIDFKEIQRLCREVEEIFQSINAECRLSENGSGYYFDVMSKDAFRAYEKGQKPWNEWTQEKLLLHCCNPQSYTGSLWLLRQCGLAYEGCHHIGGDYRYVAFYSLKTVFEIDTQIYEVQVKIRSRQEKRKVRKEGLVHAGWLYIPDQRIRRLDQPSIQILKQRKICNIEELNASKLKELYVFLYKAITEKEKTLEQDFKDEKLHL